MMRNDRAQLYTMEGIASAMLLIVVVIFVLKAAPLTANTASASHMQVEKDLELRGQDLLTVLDYTPSGSQYSQMKQAILEWTGSEFDGQASVRPPGGPTNVTARIIREVLGDIGIAYNLEVYYNTFSGTESRAMLWNGKPSDNAVIVSRKILLHDEEMIPNPGLSMIIPDIDSGSSRFYNIVVVRLTLWRM
jgi:hypothetical protein